MRQLHDEQALLDLYADRKLVRASLNPMIVAAITAFVSAIALTSVVFFQLGCRNISGTQGDVSDGELGESEGGTAPDSTQEIPVAVYFDTTTGQTLLVPISPGNYASPLADNASAFRCAIFSCGECGEITEGMTVADLEASDMYIGFLSRDPARMAEGSDLEHGLMMAEEICTVEDLKWVSMSDGRAFQRIQEAAITCDGRGRASLCRP